MASSSRPRSPKAGSSAFDAADALAVEGVLDVFTHEHRPKLASSDEKYKDESRPPGSPFRPLYDDQIRFSGQPVALVVAEEFEIARFAASLVRVEYEQEAHVTDFEAQRERAEVSKQDDAPRPQRAAMPRRHSSRRPVRIEAEYRMPVEHHNPMEPFAATAVWEGDDRITVFDKTQGPQNCRNYVADVLGMPRDKVRVLSPYVGGAFGSGLAPAISAAACRAGGARAQALGAGDPHPPADVHARLSRREHPEAGARAPSATAALPRSGTTSSP